MAGKKTHEQQLRIIENRENARNAGEDFNDEEKLKRSKQEREAHRGGARLRDEGVELTDKDDPQMIRGKNQESEHHKHRADD
jgi:hypothetical protein